MPVPIICLDEMLHHFAQRFREHLSKPQYQHFVTVLLGLMLCESTRTLLVHWQSGAPVPRAFACFHTASAPAARSRSAGIEAYSSVHGTVGQSGATFHPDI